MALTAEKSPKAVGNLLMTVMFASLGLIALLDRDYAGGGIWLGLAMALAILGPEDTAWRDIARWKRVVGSILVGASISLFALQIIEDFSR